MPKKNVEKNIKETNKITPSINKIGKTKEKNNIKKQQLINKKEKKLPKISNFLKSKITKKNIFYSILLILDIIIIIYSARNNYANYVSIDGSDPIFIGKTKDLLLGKNYITLITTAFFYIYTLLTNKILFHQKNNRNSIIGLLIFLLLINITIFFIFTKRIY